MRTEKELDYLENLIPNLAVSATRKAGSSPKSVG
jgi:hypothetical protein